MSYFDIDIMRINKLELKVGKINMMLPKIKELMFMRKYQELQIYIYSFEDADIVTASGQFEGDCYETDIFE